MLYSFIHWHKKAVNHREFNFLRKYSKCFQTLTEEISFFSDNKGERARGQMINLKLRCLFDLRFNSKKATFQWNENLILLSNQVYKAV